MRIIAQTSNSRRHPSLRTMNLSVDLVRSLPSAQALVVFPEPALAGNLCTNAFFVVVPACRSFNKVIRVSPAHARAKKSRKMPVGWKTPNTYTNQISMRAQTIYILPLPVVT